MTRACKQIRAFARANRQPGSPHVAQVITEHRGVGSAWRRARLTCNGIVLFSFARMSPTRERALGERPEWVRWAVPARGPDMAPNQPPFNGCRRSPGKEKQQIYLFGPPWRCRGLLACNPLAYWLGGSCNPWPTGWVEPNHAWLGHAGSTRWPNRETTRGCGRPLQSDTIASP